MKSDRHDWCFHFY